MQVRNVLFLCLGVMSLCGVRPSSSEIGNANAFLARCWQTHGNEARKNLFAELKRSNALPMAAYRIAAVNNDIFLAGTYHHDLFLNLFGDNPDVVLSPYTTVAILVEVDGFTVPEVDRLRASVHMSPSAVLLAKARKVSYKRLSAENVMHQKAIGAKENEKTLLQGEIQGLEGQLSALRRQRHENAEREGARTDLGIRGMGGGTALAAAGVIAGGPILLLAGGVFTLFWGGTAVNVIHGSVQVEVVDRSISNTQASITAKQNEIRLKDRHIAEYEQKIIANNNQIATEYFNSANILATDYQESRRTENQLQQDMIKMIMDALAVSYPELIRTHRNIVQKIIEQLSEKFIESMRETEYMDGDGVQENDVPRPRTYRRRPRRAPLRPVTYRRSFNAADAVPPRVFTMSSDNTRNSAAIQSDSMISTHMQALALTDDQRRALLTDREVLLRQSVIEGINQAQQIRVMMDNEENLERLVSVLQNRLNEMVQAQNLARDRFNSAGAFSNLVRAFLPTVTQLVTAYFNPVLSPYVAFVTGPLFNAVYSDSSLPEGMSREKASDQFTKGATDVLLQYVINQLIERGFS